MHITKRRTIGAALSLALITSGAALGFSSLSASGATSMNRVTMSCANQGFDSRAGKFRKQVDPIVSHGVAQSAHMHDFFGRIDITPNFVATPNLRAGFEYDPGDTQPAFSNCNQGGGTYGDWAAYWFPTPVLNGAFTQPGPLKETWQAPAGTPVVAPPFGMTFVAGDSHATSPTAHVRFTCGGSLDSAGTSTPTDCTGTGVVTAIVEFPDCWDGYGALSSYQNGVVPSTFDTPTGLSPSHFFYSTAGKCSLPNTPCVEGKHMAQLVTQQTFLKPDGTPLIDGTALTFSSGSPYTYHGDVVITWNHVLGDVTNAYLNNGPLPPGTRVDNLPIQ
jgi:hypothetical protein